MLWISIGIQKVIHSGAIFKALLKIMTNNAQMSHKLDHCVQISNGVWRDKAIQNTKCFRWIHRYWGVWISDHHCTKSWKKLKGNNFRIFRFYGRLFTTHVLYPLLIVLHFVNMTVLKQGTDKSMITYLIMTLSICLCWEFGWKMTTCNNYKKMVKVCQDSGMTRREK